MDDYPPAWDNAIPEDLNTIYAYQELFAKMKEILRSRDFHGDWSKDIEGSWENEEMGDGD